MRHAEQRAAAMRGSADRGQGRPGGVAQCNVQGVRVVRALPSGNRAGEPGLGQRLAHPRFQVGTQRGSLEPGRIGIFLHRLTLHEQPLAGMHRIQIGGAASQGQRLRLDLEQSGHELVQMRPQGDDQVALFLSRQRVRFGARGQQSCMQGRIVPHQTIEKSPVQAHQPRSARQIGQCETKPQGRIFSVHHVIHQAIRPSCAAGRGIRLFRPASGVPRRCHGLAGRMPRLRRST